VGGKAEMKRFKQERQLVGSFYFRFPNGESGADVFDRATGFIQTLFRSFESHWRQPPQNIVIVTHGLFMRLFLMRYYRKPVEWFHQVRAA
jgi:broad specificity phosphatase PhoE